MKKQKETENQTGFTGTLDHPDSGLLERLRELSEAAERLAHGDFAVPLPSGGQEELGRLQAALRGIGEGFEKQLSLLRKLSTLTAEVNAGLTLGEVLDHVYEGFREIIPYDRIGFSLLSEDGARLRASWVRSESRELELGADYEVPLEKTSLQFVLNSGKPRIINDLESYLYEHPGSESTRLLLKEGVRSSLTCPLLAQGRGIGFMFFSSRTPHAYDNAHVEIFLQVAGQLAIIVEKARLYQRLIELNDLRNRFLGMAAHDLRNPITAIKGMALIVERRVEGIVREDEIRLLQRIETACDRMLSLIDDLLDVTSIEQGKLELDIRRTEVHEVVGEAVEINNMAAQSKGIQITAELHGEVPPIHVDPDRIAQVLDNLLSNAVKFSRSDSQVLVKVERSGKEIRFSVIDQGQGIPENEQVLLFREFGRTSTQPTGGERSTGLGLAIVKKIVELHGGSVWFESRLGKGSTFSFSIPLSV